MKGLLLASLLPVEIVIIVIVAAAFTSVIISSLVVTRRRRKGMDETVLESRDELNENAHTARTLRALAEGKPQVIKMLDGLYATLAALEPSADEEVAVADEKIKTALSDLKSYLTRTRAEEDSSEAENYINKVHALISERNSIEKK